MEHDPPGQGWSTVHPGPPGAYPGTRYQVPGYGSGELREVESYSHCEVSQCDSLGSGGYAPPFTVESYSHCEVSQCDSLGSGGAPFAVESYSHCEVSQSDSLGSGGAPFTRYRLRVRSLWRNVPALASDPPVGVNSSLPFGGALSEPIASQP